MKFCKMSLLCNLHMADQIYVAQVDMKWYVATYICIYVHIHAFQTDHAYEFIEVATI